MDPEFTMLEEELQRILIQSVEEKSMFSNSNLAVMSIEAFLKVFFTNRVSRCFSYKAFVYL